MAERLQDAVLDEILGRFPSLICRPTQDEYRIFRSTEEGRGSLWIVRQRDGYRIVTTGTAHRIDRDIERISGKKPYEYSDRAHKWWKSLSDADVEQIFDIFAKV